jgi:hypothetical protein
MGTIGRPSQARAWLYHLCVELGCPAPGYIILFSVNVNLSHYSNNVNKMLLPLFNAA